MKRKKTTGLPLNNSKDNSYSKICCQTEPSYKSTSSSRMSRNKDETFKKSTQRLDTQGEMIRVETEKYE